MNPSEYRKSLEDYYAMQKAHEKEVEELQHWGIKGMKWGDRKYQYKDGSLTPEGRERYGVGDPNKKLKVKMEAERLKDKIAFKRNKDEAKLQMKMDRAAAKNDAIRIKAEQYGQVKEAKEKTEQKKIGMEAEKMAEKNRHKESSLGKKVVIAGIATVAAVAIIKAMKSNVNHAEVQDMASKGKEVVKNNDNVKKALTKTVSQAAKDNAKKGASTDWMTTLKNMNPTDYLRPGSTDKPDTHHIIGPVTALVNGGREIVNRYRVTHSGIYVQRIPKEVADHVIT